MTKHRLRVLSASQFKAFDCLRAGVWEYAYGHREKKGMAALQLGTRLHHIAEAYLKYGTEPDDTEVMPLWRESKYKPEPWLVNYLPGQIFRHGLGLLPPPGTCQVEGDIKYLTPSGPWKGARDIVTALDSLGQYYNPYLYGLAPGSLLQVWDHKTTQAEGYAFLSDQAYAEGYTRYPDGTKTKNKPDQTRLSDDPQAITYAWDLMEHWGADLVECVWVYYRTDMEKARKSWTVRHTFTRAEVVLKLEHRIDPKAEEIRRLRENPPEDPNTLEPNLDACNKYSGCAHAATRCIVSLAQRIDHSGKKDDMGPTYLELLEAAKKQNPQIQHAPAGPAPGAIAQVLMPAPVAVPLAVPAPVAVPVPAPAPVPELPTNKGQPVWVYGEPLQGDAQFKAAQSGQPVWIVAVSHPTRAPSAEWAMAQPGWMDPYIVPEQGFINPPSPLSPPAAPASPAQAASLYAETSKASLQLEAVDPIANLDREQCKEMLRALGLLSSNPAAKGKDLKDNYETKMGIPNMQKLIREALAEKAVTEAYTTPAPVAAPQAMGPSYAMAGPANQIHAALAAPAPAPVSDFVLSGRVHPAPAVTPEEENAEQPWDDGFTLLVNILPGKGDHGNVIHFAEISQAVKDKIGTLDQSFPGYVEDYLVNVAKFGPTDTVCVSTSNPEARACQGTLERLAGRVFFGVAQ